MEILKKPRFRDLRGGGPRQLSIGIRDKVNQGKEDRASIVDCACYGRMENLTGFLACKSWKCTDGTLGPSRDWASLEVEIRVGDGPGTGVPGMIPIKKGKHGEV